jgi:spore germination protein KC
MRSRWGNALAVAVVCVSSFTLTGCWDYQKINDRAQIIGIAIDPVENQPRQLSITLQVPVFDSKEGKGADVQQTTGESATIPGATKTYRNFVTRGQGVSDAISKAQMHYDKMFYLGNIQSIVLNQQLTNEQVRKVVSELVRTPSLDKLAWILVSQQSARDIFEAQSASAPADTLDRFLGANLQQHGYTTRTRLWEFWRDAQSLGIQPRAGLVRSLKTGLQVYGMVAFQNMGPSLEVQPHDTLYFNLVNDKVNRMAVWVQDGDRSFEVGDLKSKAKLSVTMQGKSPVLHAKIKGTAIVLQDETDGQTQLTSAEMHRYEGLLEKQVETEGKRVLQRFQQNKVDAYGFGEYVFLHNPSTQKFIQTQWPDAFAEAKSDIQVKITLLRKGSLM